MLEDIALQYITKSETEMTWINYGLIILGFILAAVLTRSKSELLRAPYFAYSCLLFFLVVAAQFVWLNLLPAMAGGFLWVLMSVSVVSILVFGYLTGIIALARSRGAFGRGYYSILAFVPLANLVLFLKPSKGESVNRIPTIPLVTGGVGVVSGFVVLALAVALKVSLEKQMNALVTDPTLTIESLIQSQGLEYTLAWIKDQSPVPEKLDEVTSLVELTANGKTLSYIYLINSNIEELPGDFRESITQKSCALPEMRPLLQAEGTIEYVYRLIDGWEVGTIRVTREQCGL